jgi:hypothetical protein
MIEAVCDWGAVRVQAAEPPLEIWECPCDGCQKMGVSWAYYHPSQVELIAAPGSTSAYQRASKTQDFVFCRTCGCTTHWQSHNRNDDTFGVNARLMPRAVRAAAMVRTTEGHDRGRPASWESNLGRERSSTPRRRADLRYGSYESKAAVARAKAGLPFGASQRPRLTHSGHNGRPLSGAAPVTVLEPKRTVAD